MSTCTVLCLLPNGLIIESGYSIDNGNVVRLPDYKRQRLSGANQSRLRNGNPLAPPLFTAGVTEGVDEQFFDKWVEDHKESNIVKNKQVWKTKRAQPNEAKAEAVGEMGRTNGFEPRDPTKHLGPTMKPYNPED